MKAFPMTLYKIFYLFETYNEAHRNTCTCGVRERGEREWILTVIRLRLEGKKSICISPLSGRHLTNPITACCQLGRALAESWSLEQKSHALNPGPVTVSDILPHIHPIDDQAEGSFLIDLLPLCLLNLLLSTLMPALAPAVLHLLVPDLNCPCSVLLIDVDCFVVFPTMQTLETETSLPSQGFLCI